MGYVNATIALSNPRRPELAPLSVSARADSGSLMLCIPAHLAAALRLEQECLPEVSGQTAGGSRFPMWGRFGSISMPAAALSVPWCWATRC
jgi:hypothetical protein